MTDLTKRIRKLEHLIELGDNGISWILEDGTRVKNTIENDPINFIVPDYCGQYPAICPVGFESLEPLDPLTKSIYLAAIDSVRERRNDNLEPFYAVRGKLRGKIQN